MDSAEEEPGNMKHCLTDICPIHVWLGWIMSSTHNSVPCCWLAGQGELPVVNVCSKVASCQERNVWSVLVFPSPADIFMAFGLNTTMLWWYLKIKCPLGRIYWRGLKKIKQLGNLELGKTSWQHPVSTFLELSACCSPACCSHICASGEGASWSLRGGGQVLLGGRKADLRGMCGLWVSLSFP